MSNIHPDFANLPDTQAAEAISEVLLNPADFKVESVHDLGKNAEFPPVPSHLKVIALAYVEDLPGGWNVRRKLQFLEEDVSKRAQTAANFLNGYTVHVGGMHEVADQFAANGLNVGNIALRAAEMAQEARLRTVAAFLLFETAETSEPVSGLAIPRRTYDNLPLEARDQLRKLMEVNDVSSSSYYRDNPELKQALQRILQNDPAIAELGFMAAARSLPEPAIVRATLEQTVGSNIDPRSSQPNREERRAQVHKARRAKRRKK